MCVNRYMYPLAELDNGKKKVLFDFGVLIENRDFTTLNFHLLELRKALKKRSNFSSYNYSRSLYGVKDILRFVNVPCGRCEECNKSRARGWAFRILKEAEKYNNNFFITFTYDDEFLPMIHYNDKYINSLVSDEISKFNKKLKTYLNRKNIRSDFRFYGVGEYGSKTLRPHRSLSCYIF